jgi:A/G-specific adenine glycosylase
MTNHYSATDVQGQTAGQEMWMALHLASTMAHPMTHVAMDSRNLPQIRRSLLSWYDKNQRDLPWRKTKDPYRIWVSEIMLQQTRVSAMVLRYGEFLDRFPSVQKLASARESTVLARWSGLGYYRRARNLHAAAKMIAREGRLPQRAQAWRTLPGIGRYTAAAIASIAFQELVGVLDGNVERVLRRLTGKLRTSGESWQAAETLLDRERPGDFNQAMMELGATVCLPGTPECDNCPLKKFCRTRGRGVRTGSKPRQHKRAIAYSLARRADSVRLVCRPKAATLMPGMWELPEVTSPKSSDQVMFAMRHSITVTDFRVTVLRGGGPWETGEWISLSRLNRLPLTGLTRKILRAANIIQ